MQIDSDDFRKTYENLSDEGLLAINADDLTPAARMVYDQELNQRGLLLPEDAPEEESDPAEELAELAEFKYTDEMTFAKGALEAVGIPAYDNNSNTVRLNWMWKNMLGGMRLFVPKSQLEDARAVLESFDEISEEELARQSQQFEPPED